jgi:hypothetical protein
MVKPLLVLVGGSLLAWVLTLAVWGTEAAPRAAWGLALTLPPAILTQSAVGLLARRHPEAGPTAVMAGTGLRMGWAVVAVSVLGGPVEKLGIPRQSLAEWTCGFYLVTLALETAALWGLLARPGAPKAGPPA